MFTSYQSSSSVVRSSQSENLLSQHPGINTESIMNQILENFHFIESARDKELILMIGNSGTGKSTTGNYLLGLPIKKDVDEDGIETINVDGNPVFKIGHGTDGETLYAQAAKVPNQSWSLLDCPGFSGSRLRIEDSIIESISTELAIRAAKNAKAVLILVELEDFYHTRILKMMPIIRALNKLFKMPENIAKNSILILVNKVSRNITPTQLNGCMKKLLKHCETRINTLHGDQKDTDNLTHNDHTRIFSCFTEIQSRMICINPLDNGETKQAIIDCISPISNATPMTVNDFNFPYNDVLQELTEKNLDKGIQFIKKIRRKIKNNKPDFLKYETKITRLKDELSFYQNLIKNLDEKRTAVIIQCGNEINRLKKLIRVENNAEQSPDIIKTEILQLLADNKQNLQKTLILGQLLSPFSQKFYSLFDATQDLYSSDIHFFSNNNQHVIQKSSASFSTKMYK